MNGQEAGAEPAVPEQRHSEEHRSARDRSVRYPPGPGLPGSDGRIMIMIQEQYTALPAAFEARMRQMLGDEYDAFEKSMREEDRYRSLRVNSLKTDPGTFAGRDVWELEPVPWEPAGFYYREEDRPGRHPWHEAGMYYIQEPSAMAVSALAGARPGERVLDLCAAPGGKTTGLAAAMEGRGLLAANEIHPQRARILSQNVERMGIRNALVFNEEPGRLAEHFPAYFDRIIVDAPCSGEGMFRKEAQAIPNWSPENVQLCAQRQQEILEQAVTMLADGGTLVYSTCTFAPAEDEETVCRLLCAHPELTCRDLPAELGERMRSYGFDRGHPEWIGAEAAGRALRPDAADQTARALRLWPHRLRGEGHFIAVLTKDGSRLRRRAGGRLRRPDQAMLGLWQAFSDACLRQPPEGIPHLFGNDLYLLPEEVSLQGLRVLRPGLHLGTFKKNRFEPAHALAMSLRPREAVTVRPLQEEEGEAAAWLRGESLPAEGLKGWTLVTTAGCSLGWGKAAGRILKNHYPKGLRRG